MDSKISSNGIRTEVSKSVISFDKFSVSEFQKKGTKTAHLRQSITTKSYYPSAKTSSDMQVGLFASEAFGFTNQEFESVENRMAFILVPVSATEAEVKAKLDILNANGATIYKVLDTKPILDENQEYAVGQGLRSMADYAATQAARYPVGHADAGKLILSKAGHVQYRRTLLWDSPMADQDSRGTEVWISPAIAAEINGAGVLAGQNL